MAAFSNSRPTQAAASVTAPWDPRPGIRGDGQAAAGNGSVAQREHVLMRVERGLSDNGGRLSAFARMPPDEKTAAGPLSRTS